MVLLYASTGEIDVSKCIGWCVRTRTLSVPAFLAHTCTKVYRSTETEGKKMDLTHQKKTGVDATYWCIIHFFGDIFDIFSLSLPSFYSPSISKHTSKMSLTHIQIFYLALVLSIHNKQQEESTHHSFRVTFIFTLGFRPFLFCSK